jgi:serine/threonine protein kinase
VLEIGLALTEALGHLHGHGLVHRDVKPSNVIFVNGRPKLADIGLVTDASDQCSIVGTEGYLPPEGPGTPQADIFSLGKVLYEAATGLDRQKFPDLPPDLKEWADCSAVLELNEIVLKACAAASSQRYAGAEKMLSDLQRLGQGGSVRRARQRARTWHLVRRVAVGVAATAGLFSLIVLASRIRQPGVVQHVERRSTNAPANHYFELGKANFDLFQGTNMAQAAGYFEKAVQADTNFAQAYGYLAATYFWGGFEDWNQNWVFLPRAREAALRALKLDVTLAEPHLALGTYHGMREWNWIDAEKEDRQAVDLNPSWFCHLCYAELLRVMGRTDESLKEIYQAGNLNPSSRIINNRLVHYLVCAREFDKALEQIDKIVAMQAVTEKDVIWIRMEIFLALGQTDKAIEAERDGRIADGDPRADAERDAAAKMRAPPAERARLLWLPYLDGAAQRISFPRWAKPQKDSYWLYQQARAYAQLGQADAALTRLEDLLKERDTSLTFNVMGDWTLDPLRREKRFHKILRTMHFE